MSPQLVNNPASPSSRFILSVPSPAFTRTSIQSRYSFRMLAYSAGNNNFSPRTAFKWAARRTVSSRAAADAIEKAASNSTARSEFVRIFARL